MVTSLTKSKKCWLFHDHVLVKSGPALSTPIHHDRPYYIFDGDLNAPVNGFTADDVKRDSSLVFYKNSHKTDRMDTYQDLLIQRKNDLAHKVS